jgi:hypothetical protein
VRRASGRVQAAAERVQRGEACLGRAALVDEDLLQPLGQGRVHRRCAQQRTEHREGIVRLAKLHVQRPGQTQALLAGLFAGEPLQSQAPHGAELAPAPLALQQPLQRGRDLGVRGAHLEQPVEVPDGTPRISREVLRDPGGLSQELGASLVPAPGREAGVVAVEDVAPALAHRQRDDERPERPVRIGCRREHGAKDVDRLGRVLAEAVRREPGGAARQDLVHRPGQISPQLGPIKLEQTARLRLVGRDGLLQAAPGRLVAWLADRVVQRLVERLDVGCGGGRNPGLDLT